ncbi:asparagine synthetase domain-containing protein 1 [Periconia macrospinosa]|uniref:Asparagine synthetase domain-containing protein 1 n=1 Tax=Periconia macrospinosa TaxID=97972 RepID=A0A2V1DS31_9PLEO|nr:asparagine synthetase domain-containing protein 1 [Periconia macrospinosa]
MCGIFFSLSRDDREFLDFKTKRLLEHRGPDSIRGHSTLFGQGDGRFYATLWSSVLSLRGNKIEEQPVVHIPSGDVLCWNGEAWSSQGMDIIDNDSSYMLYNLMMPAMPLEAERTRQAVASATIRTLSSVRGPFAFVFYDAENRFLYYGRDCLGRRSLLQKVTTDDQLILSSVCDNSSGEKWKEIDADGIYMVDLDYPDLKHSIAAATTHIPRRRGGELDDPFPSLNLSVDSRLEDLHSHPSQVLDALRKSVKVRTERVRRAVKYVEDPHRTKEEARIAILFSGGLDCTILAKLVHECLPPEQSIDLLNVAFENPRIHNNLDTGVSPYELCPDRITGRSSFAELLTVCPGRLWRFVAINVPYKDTKKHREMVKRLMHPHNTEMDLSISYALYFASKASGMVHDSSGERAYTSTARVLLSGLGADELFGGYQRHATAYSRRGYDGLLDELWLDFSRLGKRNLGRDDRVISDSGREVRFPYLDENFISLVLQLPVRSKCDFGQPETTTSDDPFQFLEPGKRLLRVAAWFLGMKKVAAEKKRAIQFGARTAKMETGKTKGTQVLLD